MATTDVWTYRDNAWTGTALIGMSVEAIDGAAGKVEGATDDAGGISPVDRNDVRDQLQGLRDFLQEHSGQ